LKNIAAQMVFLLRSAQRKFTGGALMPFCKSCGQEIGSAAFCPKCGAGQGAMPTPGGAAPTAGLAENIAGVLCYAVGWVTGIIFLLVDKRPFFKFHAAQSIVVFGGLHLLSIILGMFLGVSFFTGGFHFLGPGVLFLHLVNLASLVLWILLMIKAYQGLRFKLPVAADLAESIAGK
jgi:uncharacterized membrane protein